MQTLANLPNTAAEGVQALHVETDESGMFTAARDAMTLSADRTGIKQANKREKLFFTVGDPGG
jgi:hypothetical protein